MGEGSGPDPEMTLIKQVGRAGWMRGDYWL